jgi:NEDD8-activating enzyme E1 regulatory subunit
MEDHEHGHVPYILLLLHYLDKWKESHEGRLPENYREKTAFKAMVGAGARADNAEGGEENFDEAVGAVMKSINAPSLGSNVREMFELEECVSPSIDSANFWVVASAIKDFHGKHGVLPLPGSLPDMKAFSTEYIKLQNIYKSKARGDVAEVSGLVRGIEEQLKRKTPVPDQEIEAFCKNAAHIKVIHGSTMPAPGVLSSLSSKIAKKLVNSELQNPESLFPIWLAFNAFDSIVSKSPGKYSTTLLLDTQEWKKKLETDVSLIYQQSQAEKSHDAVTVPEEVIERVLAVAKEMQRSEGGELHNIASLTGGMVAQEAIKVVTRQYVPVDNTCIFDGVFSKSQALKMG